MALIQIGSIDKEEAEEEKVAIGIDLGTSNSLVSYYNKESRKIEIISDKFGKIIPSIVKYFNKDILVGKQALLEEKGSYLKSIKRVLGKNISKIKPEELDFFDINKEKSSNNLKIIVGEYEVTPEEVSSEILKYLKNLAIDYLQTEIKDVVITVPAYFDENQRIATKNAANLAGLNVLRLINEPTAAALAYGLDKSLEGIYVIYDLGGGTFDISILNLQKGIFKVLATAGDTSLGGDDIDTIVAKLIWQKLDENCNFDNLDSKIKKDLLLMAKGIKEEFSSKKEILLDLNSLNINKIITITIEEFNNSIQSIIAKTLEISKIALIDANTSLADIQGVVLVGGSSRILFLQEQVRQFFKKIPLCSIDPDEVVAIGAGYKAAELSGNIESSLLLDVIPLSLGIEIAGGIFEKIILRNTLIPIKKKQEFTTYKDNQTSILIHILQGERELVKNVRSLGKFILKGIPPFPAGIAKIVVIFSVDADGLLTVEAFEKETKIKQQIEIKPSWGISVEDMRFMIEDSMKNAEKDINKRLFLQAKIEAERIISATILALKEDKNLISPEEATNIQEKINILQEIIADSLQNLLNKEKIEIYTNSLIKATDNLAQKRMNKKIEDVLKGKGI